MDADPERRKRVEELRQAYDAVLRLAELRASRGVTRPSLPGWVSRSLTCPRCATMTCTSPRSADMSPRWVAS